MNGDEPDRVNPARVVADADVLAADLLVGGVSRESLDYVRSHSWIELVASDHLLSDARAVIRDLADEALAGDWYERITDECVTVEHPPNDHPALASAYRGSGAHLLTFDETFASAGTNLSIGTHVSVSIRTPDAFVSVFDPEPLYESLHDGEYPGPDRDPRA